MDIRTFDVNNSVNSKKTDEVKRIAAIGVDATKKHIYGIVKNEQGNSITADIEKNFDSKVKDDENDLDKAFGFAVLRYATRNENFCEEDLAQLKDPNFVSRTDFQERYYEVINTVLSTTIPAVSTTFLGRIAEVKSIGFGDTAQFDIDSNEIFQVSRSATGVAFGANQRKYRKTVTVNPYDTNITFDTDWYQIASGVFDFGKNFYRASAGYAHFFTSLAYQKFNELTSTIPAAYKLSGWSDKDAREVLAAVQSANNNTPVSLFGTKVALGSVVPENDFMKFGVSEEWVLKGYVGTWAGYSLVEAMQLMNPLTINEATTRDFLINNDKIWVLPMNGKRPIKIVFEGGMFNLQKAATDTADMTERASLHYRVGVEAVYDQIYGEIELV